MLYPEGVFASECGGEGVCLTGPLVSSTTWFIDESRDDVHSTSLLWARVKQRSRVAEVPIFDLRGLRLDHLSGDSGCRRGESFLVSVL